MITLRAPGRDRQIRPLGSPARKRDRGADPPDLGQYGLDKRIYVQYVKTINRRSTSTGKAYSYTQNINVLQEIGHDFPATLSLAFGAGITLAADLDPVRHGRGGLRRPLRRPGS